MILKQVDRAQERRLLIWRIVSREFIEKTPFLKDYHFDGLGARIVYQWSRDFYEKYRDAPGSHITDIFIAEEFNLDDDSKNYIEKLLTSLSGEWEKRKEFNLDAAVDIAREFTNRKEAELLQKRIQQAVEAGRVDEVYRLTDEFKPIANDAKAGRVYQPFSSPENARNAFDRDTQEILIHLPVPLGRLLNSQFYRGSFVAFLAAEKAGKSFLLQYLGMRAWFQGRNVVIFEAGDLTAQQRNQRMYQYMCALPNDRNYDPGQHIDVKYPGRWDDDSSRWIYNFEGNYETLHLPNIDGDLAAEGFENWIRRKHWAGGSRNQFHVVPYSNSTLDSKLVREHLEELKKKFGFSPDVVIDDYMDIHAPEGKLNDYRHQENEKWKAAANIRQEYNCCYITCTQSRKLNSAEWVTRDDVSEDKRKTAHVTAFFGINRTDEDREKSIVRINDLGLTRDREKMPPVTVLQCLALGQPYLDSKWFNPLDKSDDNGKDVEAGVKKASGRTGKASKPKPKSKSALARELLKRGLMDVAEIAKETGISKGTVRDLQTELRKNGKLPEND